MTLDFNILQKVNLLFEEQGWDIKEKEGSIYDNYCKRLELLKDNPCRELMIDLSKRFYIVSFNQIYEDIQVVFFNIEESIYNKYNKIYILPLSEKLYIEPIPSKTKSGEAYFYNLKQSGFFSWFDYFPKKFICLESIEHINLNDTENGFFFIDDYIGSGFTVQEIIEGINSKFKTSINSRSHILVPFAQQGAIDELKKKSGISVYTNTIFKKGISDYYSDFPQKIDLMKKIEEYIDKELPLSDNHLGFAKTEALIRLIGKTPNNTFPLFWYKPKKKTAPQAPFPRYDFV